MLGNFMGADFNTSGSMQIPPTATPPIQAPKPQTSAPQGFNLQALLPQLANFANMQGHEQDALTSHLAQQGPPPQVQMAPPVGQSLVGDQMAKALAMEQQKRMAGSPIGATKMPQMRGEALTSSGVGGSLVGGGY